VKHALRLKEEEADTK